MRWVLLACEGERTCWSEWQGRVCLGVCVGVWVVVCVCTFVHCVRVSAIVCGSVREFVGFILV